MPYLLDTNVLLRIMLPGNPDHEIVRMSLRRLREQNQDCVYLTQNIVEFWNVSTRPASARGGLGLHIATIEQRCARALRNFDRKCYSFGDNGNLPQALERSELRRR